MHPNPNWVSDKCRSMVLMHPVGDLDAPIHIVFRGYEVAVDGPGASRRLLTGAKGFE